MPYIDVHTNVEPADAAQLREDLISVAAEALGKPPGIFAASISVREVTFKSSQDPAAIINVTTLPVQDDQVRTLAPVIAGTAADGLGIGVERVWVTVQEVATNRWIAAGKLVSGA